MYKGCDWIELEHQIDDDMFHLLTKVNIIIFPISMYLQLFQRLNFITKSHQKTY